MVIDFHTHIFPDKIASHAIEVLKDGIRRISGCEGVNYTDATYDGLLQSMEECGVDTSVVLPIVTNPLRPQSINDFAEKIRSGRVISFGGIHPLEENASRAVYELKERGFAGFKLHPEFQGVYIDSEESIAVLKAAEDAELLVVLHSGKDIGIAPPVHCTPQRLKNVLKYVSGKNIIAAHMGAWEMWDEVEEYLIGSPIMLDTAFVKDYIGDERFYEMVRRHGEDKILFGSDSPWERPSDTLEFIARQGFEKEIFDMIMYKNAKRLLKLR